MFISCWKAICGGVWCWNDVLSYSVTLPFHHILPDSLGDVGQLGVEPHPPLVTPSFEPFTITDTSSGRLSCEERPARPDVSSASAASDKKVRFCLESSESFSDSFGLKRFVTLLIPKSGAFERRCCGDAATLGV